MRCRRASSAGATRVRTKLPKGKILLPGVVTHSTNIIEHPELVAWPVMNFARLVGRENVITGTDCGFSQFWNLIRTYESIQGQGWRRWRRARVSLQRKRPACSPCASRAPSGASIELEDALRSADPQGEHPRPRTLEWMDPIFGLDLRDMATGKQVAVELSREQALRPLGGMLHEVLRASPKDLSACGRIAPQHADTFLRLQDLVYPVDERGVLADEPYAGLVWRQRDGMPLAPEQPVPFERVRRADAPDVLLLSLEIDRQALRYERNWRGFHARRFACFRPAAERLLAEALPCGITLADSTSQRRLVEAVARRIWQADFENYSRFFAPAIRLKTGDETVANILAGRGGVCTEKVLALKYLTDAQGIESRVVFAGPHTRAPLPLSELRTMLDEMDTYDFTYARRYLRYWDHVALEYRLADGSCWLVDPSNGNTPFLCDPSAPYLDDGGERRSIPVRVLAIEEPVTYHRVPESLGLDFLFAWETWVADVDLMQVFDNNLGLLVGREFYVTAAVWGSETKRAVAIDGWRRYARQHGLRLGLTSGDGLRVTTRERRTAAAFAARLPQQARDCVAALPGLARRYREHMLVRYGIDKQWGADLVVLDRRPILGQPAAADARP